MTDRRETGLTLIETLVAITVFSIMTVGLVPLIGTAMSGGAKTRTESVARNVTSKTLERLRGLQYHVAYSSAPRKVDLLDQFFPGRTPAYVPSVGTGYDSATQSYVTTCDELSTNSACRALPDGAELPEGYLVEVRATFRTPANPAATAPVPVGYAWNATGSDTPPSELLEVKVTTAWSVGTKARTFVLSSYLGARAKSSAPGGSGGATPPPSGGGGAPPPPTTVKLRAEARIDYGYELSTTYQDASSPARISEFTGTLGNAVAYGEQLDSGSKADLSIKAGQIRIVRPPNPAVSGDAGLDVNVNGAVLEAHAPPDATLTSSVSAVEQYAMNAEVPISGGSGYVAPSEAGTMTGARGVSPTVAGGLPFARGYYDLNGTASVSPASGAPTHMWMMPQVGVAGAGTETTINPLNHFASSFSKKTVSIHDGSGNVDPRGEVMVDATPTSPAASRVVTAQSSIPAHGMVLVMPSSYTPINQAIVHISQFSASVSCAARSDASATSTASGSWSAELSYYEDTDTRDNRTSYVIRRTTLPVQTRTDNPTVPQGSPNPLQLIKNQNGGNGPLIFDTTGTTYDVWLFAGNGKRGLLTAWSQGAVETTVSSDDRVASAELNGAIRLESSPLYGPWPNASTGQVSQRPLSDFTLAVGKLSCRAEDYR